MDIQSYISSGILETYILGELTIAEALEVEQMANRYPEVKIELQAIESCLRAVAKEAAVDPPASLREILLTKVDTLPIQQENLPTEGRLRPLEIKEPARDYTWLMAASIALALLSSISAIIFYNRWQDTENELISLRLQSERFADRVDVLVTSNSELKAQVNVTTSPSYQIVQLLGQAPAPEAKAQVYWNPETAEVFITPGSLPKPPAKHQYQLWVLVDGSPHDMGVLSREPEGLQRMKLASQANAFAITLEPEGGSVKPTLTQMYAVGPTS